MSHASFPSQPGSQVHDPARRPAFRLSDAGKIAMVRLDSEGDGSLKAALSGVDGRGPPRDPVEQLASRIELAQAAYTPPVVSSTLPFADEPNVASVEADDFALPEWSDARAVMLAELHAQATAPEEAQPTYWQPAARDTDHYAPPAQAVAQPAVAMNPAPVAELPLPEMLLPEMPLPEMPAAKPDVVPIANALDAAAKLTADATATAAALENLTRLLEKHQRATAAMPAPQPVAQPQPRPTPRPDGPMRPRPQPRAAASKPQPAAQPIKPPALRAQPSAREPIFDVRGFMAGFALSCAIGAVLYIYLI